jgi:hypothetical protein
MTPLAEGSDSHSRACQRCGATAGVERVIFVRSLSDGRVLPPDPSGFYCAACRSTVIEGPGRAYRTALPDSDAPEQPPTE